MNHDSGFKLMNEETHGFFIVQQIIMELYNLNLKWLWDLYFYTLTLKRNKSVFKIFTTVSSCKMELHMK